MVLSKILLQAIINLLQAITSMINTVRETKLEVEGVTRRVKNAVILPSLQTKITRNLEEPIVITVIEGDVEAGLETAAAALTAVA